MPRKTGRREKDALGAFRVPEEAYYGIQTVRAALNFPISSLRASEDMVEASVLVKKAAALANMELGSLEKPKARAIIRACEEILKGRLRNQFIVDVFQMGAGTSFHMNVNEVIANRAEEIMGGRKGQYRLVDPHDHVNMGQSTNDVYPTAMRLASSFLLRDLLVKNLKDLEEVFYRKSREFSGVVKSGRTHLQDAAPVTLGQEFRAYGQTLTKCREFIQRAARSLLEMGIGGSAVGTGLNTTAGYRILVVKKLRAMTGLDLKPAEGLHEAMQSMRPFLEVSAALRNLAVEMNRIANDLRLLSSGPRTGLGEIRLPEVAPGSSIMPGKVNPSMLEMMNMVCYQVLGGDSVITQAAQAGQLELNVMMPVISFNLDLMIKIMGRALKQVKTRCLEGIEADILRCRNYADRSLALVTALAPRLGYSRSVEIAREALESGKTIREIVAKKKILTSEEIEELLNAGRMARPLARKPKKGR